MLQQSWRAEPGRTLLLSVLQPVSRIGRPSSVPMGGLGAGGSLRYKVVKPCGPLFDALSI
jgi:hypothetical protein